MNNKFFIYMLAISFVGVLITSSCKKDEEGDDTDKQLYDMAKSATGFTWYKNSDVLLGKSSGSGHSQPFLRTRYNSIAAAVLDTAGKVTEGTIFPDGSLIVKELINSSNATEIYAILYKKAGHQHADGKGWVWGYLNADGSVRTPASEKGNSCTGCHSQDGNIDYMLMNKFFP